MNFQGKKILFLSPRFFGYEEAITARLQQLGAEVTFIDERPGNSLLSKGLVRVKSRLIRNRTVQYYRTILRDLGNKNFDFFLLIKGETVPDFFLQTLRKTHPQTVFIYYTYDSVAEYPRFRDLFRKFQRSFTFDPDDAAKFNVKFRPLFYVPEYLLKEKAGKMYDLIFIGTAHTDRYIAGEKVLRAAENHSLRTFFCYYAPGRLAFYLKRIFDKNMQAFDRKKLNFKSFSHKKIRDLYRQSVAVLDLNKPFQKGLTMRTFEALAAGCKLVTTNGDIKRYPFYNPQNILVVDREKPVLNPGFFSTPFQPINENILHNMSLDAWLETLFFTEAEFPRD